MGVQHARRNTEDYHSEEVEAMAGQVATEHVPRRPFNVRREAAPGERCEVRAARSIGLQVARRTHSTAPRREAPRQATRNMAQEAARSAAWEAARNTHTGQRQAGRSADRRRNRIRRLGQQKPVGP
jgi:hypothetical protein